MRQVHLKGRLLISLTLVAGAMVFFARVPECAAGAGGGLPIGASQPARPLTPGPTREVGASLQRTPKTDEPILPAHAIVVRTSPAQDGVAVGDIGKVDVWYDAGIRDSLAALAVVSADGDRVDKRDASGAPSARLRRSVRATGTDGLQPGD